MSVPKYTRREQEALEVIYRNAPCTAADIQRKVGVSYSAARALLSRLVKKGVISQRYSGPRYVYEPSQEPAVAGRNALKSVVATFFKGNHAVALGALLALSNETADDAELARLEAMVQAARDSRADSDD